ncbi:MAG TPA: carbamoyltransferase C-terminal domain-containing protein [Rubricoccaceae bacterium]
MPLPIYVLGINAYHGDVSAVLLRDGAVVAALEEERFRRIKHYAGFPTESIQRCLQMGGITGADVAHVAISRDPRANLLKKAAFAIKKRPDLRLILDRVQNARKVRDVTGPLADALGVPADRLPPVHGVEHHPAHLASAFFVSPFDEAAVCAIDGFGDFVSTSLAAGKGNRIDVLDRVYFPHSLGMLYTAVTQHLGFLGFGDEFKVMGLAPYGEPAYVDEVSQLVTLTDDGLFELNLPYFRHWSEGVEMEWDEGYPTMGLVYSDKLADLLGPPRDPKAPLEKRHEDMARSVQAVYERAAFHILNGLHERTGQTNLTLAGGCAMNSVANGKIRLNTPFTEVYVQPASGDNGTALGAALWTWHQTLGHPRAFEMTHGYWGTSYPTGTLTAGLPADDPDWTYAVTECTGVDETSTRTAALLAEGNVVGWFQGRMEWGSRALGNRSILADPRRTDMRDLINTKIKFRERFRPFAPSILEERLDDYFVGGAVDPFMQQVYPIREERRAEIPAVTHADGSGRLQTVSARDNPRYHALISAFDALTGTPIVLNTSFNENEPIVDTPAQALDCFLRTRMDVLVVNDTIVHRQPRS